MTAGTPQHAGAWLVDRGHARLSAVIAVAIMALSLLPPGLDFAYMEDGTGESRTLLGTLQWPVLFLAAAWLWSSRWRLALEVLRWINPLLPLTLGWFLASTLWSVAPADTLSRVVKLVGIALCAWAFTLASWQPGRFWRFARVTLGAIAAASVFAALFLPEVGTHGPDSQEYGKWRGLTTNKNILGPAAGIGFLLWLHAWASREVLLRHALPGLLVCAVALAGSRSSSAWLAVALAAVPLLLALRSPVDLRGKGLPVVMAVLLVVVVPLHVYWVWEGSLLFADVAAPVAGLVGKDLTLTGRSEIWRFLLDEIPRHPWLGVGHGAYWLGQWSLSDRAIRALYWIPNQGHNFYLDLVNESGVVGAVLFAAFVAVYARAIRRLAAVDWPLAVLNGVLLLFLLVQGLTETQMFRAITFPTVLMFFASLDASRRLLEAELQRRRAAPSG